MKRPTLKERREVLEAYPGVYVKRDHKECPLCGGNLLPAAGTPDVLFCERCAY